MKRFSIKTASDLEKFVKLAEKHGGIVKVYHPSLSNAALKNLKLIPDDINLNGDSKLANGLVKQKDLSRAIEKCLRSVASKDLGWCAAVIAVPKVINDERPHAHIAVAEFSEGSSFFRVWKDRCGNILENNWRWDRQETMELGDGLSEASYIADKHTIRNTSQVYFGRGSNPPEHFIKFYESLCDSFITNT